MSINYFLSGKSRKTLKSIELFQAFFYWEPICHLYINPFMTYMPVC